MEHCVKIHYLDSWAAVYIDMLSPIYVPCVGTVSPANMASIHINDVHPLTRRDTHGEKLGKPRRPPLT